MARVFPFRGYRYSPEKVNQISDVVTQPYDKISPEMWADYMRRHPNNIVRIIKNRNYEQASNYLHSWIQDGVLKQDDVASFYPYEQTFEFDGQSHSRLGFIGLVSVENSDVDVKGHERILDAPLEDRLNLMRSTEANDGLIFMLYSDASMQVEQLLSDFKESQEPIIEATDDYGASHRVWQLSNDSPQQHIVEALKDATLYIADGHHRFQTSVLYFQEASKKGCKSAAAESFDKRIVAFFNMESPAVKILPTHRGVRNLEELNMSDLLSQFEPCFEIDTVVGRLELELAMKEPGVRIGMFGQDRRLYVLGLKNGQQDNPEFMPHVSGAARQLDVNILHEGILNPFLGIGPDQLASQENVGYFRDGGELIQRVSEDDYQLAFLLNPTTLEQVREISEAGGKMPQKSTDFYPKLLSGLVLMKMEIE